MSTPDTVPAGGRDILSLLDLAPMDTGELVAGLGWPHGAVMGLLIRLRSMGVIRMTAGRWTLTGMAELHALAPREPARPVEAAEDRRAG